MAISLSVFAQRSMDSRIQWCDLNIPSTGDTGIRMTRYGASILNQDYANEDAYWRGGSTCASRARRLTEETGKTHYCRQVQSRRSSNNSRIHTASSQWGIYYYLNRTEIYSENCRKLKFCQDNLENQIENFLDTYNASENYKQDYREEASDYSLERLRALLNHYQCRN